MNKKLKVRPWANKIQLDFPTTKAGALIIEAGSSIQEIGRILAMGPDCVHLAMYDIGQRLLIKTWDVDVITVGEEKFYFISEDSRAICAVVS